MDTNHALNCKPVDDHNTSIYSVNMESKWKCRNRPKIENQNGASERTFLTHTYSESLPKQVSVCPWSFTTNAFYKDVVIPNELMDSCIILSHLNSAGSIQ
ncbi:unnamed protein product [Nesidiocoris tenuis]|uniref:Uncharacterized protein n=1 Tax=Nesidiocoris tenuis TaxID=355587 RepID=A0A6H5GLT0_9HEMI|nr:unnamed protein product [Nesidiocoris tenuis]